MTERVRLAFRLLRLQEPGSAPRIFREMEIPVSDQIFAYLAALQIVNRHAYRRVCDEYSEVIKSLRRGELERHPDTSLRFFAQQLVLELQWTIVASETGAEWH